MTTAFEYRITQIKGMQGEFMVKRRFAGVKGWSKDATQTLQVTAMNRDLALIVAKNPKHEASWG